MSKKKIATEFPLIFLTEIKNKREAKSLWAQGISLEDYDYILVVPLECLSPADLRPIAYALDRMLVGSCSNKWYRAKFRGKEVGMGIAYHS